MPLFPELLQLADLGLLLLRVVVGVIFLVHGFPKLLKPAMMAKGLGWPNGAAMLLGLVEVLSALALILGVYAQLGAIFLAIVMVGALFHHIAKWKTPFTTFGKGGGWEFDLLLLAAALVLATSNTAAYSLL